MQPLPSKQSAPITVLMFLAFLLLSMDSHAGANSGGRARLTWDREWNTPTLEAIRGDTLILYCRIEDAPQLAALGLVLEWQPRATTQCFQQVTTPVSLNCGRVILEPDGGPRNYGGRTFDQRIVFPPGAPRDLVAYTFLTSCDDPPPTTFTLGFAAARDDAGRLDGLAIIGVADCLGGRWSLPHYEPPTALRVDVQMGALWNRWRTDARVRRLSVRPTVSNPSVLPSFALSTVQNRADTLGISGTYRLEPTLIAEDEGIYSVFLKQYLGEIPVYGGALSLHALEGSDHAVLGNRFMPLSGPVNTAPTITADEAIRFAYREVGLPLPASGSATLTIYPGRQAELAWQTNIPDWCVFVSATSGQVLAIESATLNIDAPGRVWAPHPMAAANNPFLRSTGLNDCQPALDAQYKTVTLKDLYEHTPGVPRLENDRTKLVNYGPPVTTTPIGQFIFNRAQPPAPCAAPDDPGYGFAQVMAFYYVDASQSFVQRPVSQGGLGLAFNVNGQDVDAIDLGCNAGGYNWIDDVVCVGQSPYVREAEDHEFLLHEYGHSLLADACLGQPDFGSLDPEAANITEAFGDLFGAIAVTPEPTQFDRLVFEWTFQHPWATGSSPRLVTNSDRYPHDMTPDTHAASTVWSGSLWAAFKAYETVLGSCAPANEAFAPCEARRRFLRAALTATRQSCTTSPSMRNIASAMVEYERLQTPAHPQLVEALVDALDRRGHFFSEQGLPFGAQFTPIATAVDQSTPASQTVRMRVENATYSIADVKLYYVQGWGPFTNPPITMSPVGQDEYLAQLPAIGGSGVVRYYVEARNSFGGTGVRVRWPKSAPEEDAAAYLVNPAGVRPFFSCGSCNTVIQPGGTGAVDINVTGVGTVVDVNCFVKLQCSTMDKVEITLTRLQPAAVTVTLLHPDVTPGFNWLSSLPTSFEWWFDDEKDAYYNHFKPWSWQTTRPDTLTAFDGVTADSIWRLQVRVASDGAAATLEDYRLQFHTPPLIGIVESLGPPLRTAVGPCFPNPVATSTVIPFSLAERGAVTIKIYDVGGREVQELKTLPLAPGHHSIGWDGRGSNGARVASGVYFYDMSASARTFKGRMVILK